MLTHLRKIRSSLIESGATRKYLLYAIGEVLLVMVGILLALQVNNWNEWRKDRIKEKEVLKDLQINLQSNVQFLEENIELFSFRSNASSIVLNVMDNKLSYHDSLSTHFFHAARGFGGAEALSFVGFEALRNIGFDIITNKNLKNEILLLFESTYPKFISVDNELDRNDVFITEVLSDYFYPGEDVYVPFDYDELLTSRKTYSIFKQLDINKRWMGDKYEECLSETQRILQLVENELEDKNS